MGKLMYYWNQSIATISKRKTSIIWISILLSMISGLSIYFNSVNQLNFISDFDVIPDYELTHQNSYLINENGTSHLSLDFTSHFGSTSYPVTRSLLNNKIKYTEMCQFANIKLRNGFYSFTSESVNLSSYESLTDLKASIMNSPIEFAFFDEIFYESDRFSQFFYISEGRVPNQADEILIDYDTQLKHNISVGQKVNLTLILGDVSGFQSDPTKLGLNRVENLTISGVYVPKLELFKIAGNSYSTQYVYLNSKIEKIDDNSILFNPLTFIYLDLDNNFAPNIFQPMVNYLENEPNMDSGLYSLRVESGYWIFIDRYSIGTNQLNLLSQRIKDQTSSFRTSLSGENLDILDFLSIEIKNYQLRGSKISIGVILILILPFVLLTFLLTPLFYQKHEKMVKERLLFLRGRGFGLKLISKQLYFETLLTSIITSFLAIVFGILVFFVFNAFLKDVFLVGIEKFILPTIQIWDVLIVAVVSIFVNFFSAINMIKRINKIEYSNLANFAEEKEKILDFDENIIYKPENITNSFLYKKIRRILSKITKKPFQPIEKSNYEFSTFEISKKTIMFLFVGLIPIVFYVLVYIRIHFQVSDSYIDFSDILIQNYDFFNLIIYIGISFLIIGIVRLLFIENPFIFANISRIISRVFISDLDKLLGLDIIRKKQWSRMMSYIGIYIAILISTNMIYTTQCTNTNLMQNIKIGADFITTSSYNNFNEVDKFDQFNSFLLEEDRINNFEFCFIDSGCRTLTGNLGTRIPFDFSLYTLDISNYLNIIQESGKNLPNSKFDEKLERLIPTDDAKQTDPIPVYLSHYFLKLIEKDIDDIISVQHYAYNPVTNESISIPLELQILGRIGIMPGLFEGETVYNREEAIFMDINSLDLLARNYFQGKTIKSLIDLEIDEDDDFTMVSNQILEKFETYTVISTYSTYDQNWNTIENVEFNLNVGSNGFYRMTFTILIIVGILLGIESAPITKNLIEDDQKELRNLLNRGFDQKSFLKLFILEGMILFLEALFIGVIVGFLFSFVQNKITFQVFQFTVFDSSSIFLNFPVRIQFGEIVGGIILSLGFFLLVFLSIFSPSLKENEESSNSLLLKFKIIFCTCVILILNFSFLMKFQQGLQIGVLILVLWFLIEMLKPEFSTFERFIFRTLYNNRSKIFILLTLNFFFTNRLFSTMIRKEKVFYFVIAVISYFAIQAIIQDVFLSKRDNYLYPLERLKNECLELKFFQYCYSRMNRPNKL